MEVFIYNNWLGFFLSFFLASHAGITNFTEAPNGNVSMVLFSSRKLHKLFVGPYNLVIHRKTMTRTHTHTHTHTHKWEGGEGGV